MMILCLIIAALLGWSLGKNNMSNLFGTAVGTRMVRLKTASILALIFVFIGAFCSGSATTSTVLKIGELKTPADVVFVMMAVVLVLEGLSRLGIPASIVQSIVGSLIGWNLYQKAQTDWTLIKQMLVGWFCAPAIAAIISFLCMQLTRYVLTHYPVSIFIRDMIVRIGLILIGILAAYTLGANNTGTITGLCLNIFPQLTIPEITFMACTAIGIGCLMADKKVIKTIGRKLFPLSPTEALIVMIGTDISMMCFSMQSLHAKLEEMNLPAFPLVPIPMSAVMIGSICGIALTKKGDGLNGKMLVRIILSWVFIPITASGLCYSLLSLFHLLG